ncbi:MAG: glycosyltransferase family 4 protein [Bacteroidales bacterium]|nr:glycosyltransferase family 4 protein [Bacteroidales bacterium]
MNKKRKVVIVGSAYPLRGGLTVYNERLARAYMENGDDVTIFTFSLQYPNFLFPGKSQYSNDPPPADLNIKVRINSINPFNWVKVGKEIKKLKADLVIIKFWIPFMAPSLGTIARIIRKNKVSRVITIIDNIIPHEKRIGDRTLAAYWAKSVDGFVAMSKNVLKDIESFETKKPKIYCPHPLYDNFGKSIPKIEARKLLNINPSEKIALFFGFIRDYKGLDILLESMASPKIKKLGIKLLVAGEFYTDAKPYFDIIKKHELVDQVIMSNDFIPDGEVANYFCAADVIVQPYKDATQSGVTQIAYHFEKPIITTNVGGLAEIVPDGVVGYVVEPVADQIAESIEKFYLQNKEIAFSENARTEKNKYSWENLINSINLLL